MTNQAIDIQLHIRCQARPGAPQNSRKDSRVVKTHKVGASAALYPEFRRCAEDGLRCIREVDAMQNVLRVQFPNGISVEINATDEKNMSAIRKLVDWLEIFVVQN